jgi:histidinol dehydrogenase
MSRSVILFEKLVAKITEFTASAPVTIQTMLCEVDGEGPPSQEALAWEQLVVALAATAPNGTGGIRKVQLYGKARPAPEDPKAGSLSVEYLEERAASLRQALNAVVPIPPVEVFP